jgi:hypothetical protein
MGSKQLSQELESLRGRVAGLQKDYEAAQEELSAQKEAVSMGGGDVQALTMSQAKETALSGVLADVHREISEKQRQYDEAFAAESRAAVVSKMAALAAEGQMTRAAIEEEFRAGVEMLKTAAARVNAALHSHQQVRADFVEAALPLYPKLGKGVPVMFGLAAFGGDGNESQIFSDLAAVGVEHPHAIFEMPSDVHGAIGCTVLDKAFLFPDADGLGTTYEKLMRGVWRFSRGLSLDNALFLPTPVAASPSSSKPPAPAPRATQQPAPDPLGQRLAARARELKLTDFERAHVEEILEIGVLQSRADAAGASPRKTVQLKKAAPQTPVKRGAGKAPASRADTPLSTCCGATLSGVYAIKRGRAEEIGRLYGKCSRCQSNGYARR